MSLDLGTLEATLKLNAAAFISELKKASQATGSFSKTVGTVAGGVASALKTATLAATGLSAGLTASVVGVTKVHQKFESLSRSMEFAAGSTDNANKVFGQLRAVSDTLGVEIEALSSAYNQMSAAAGSSKLTSNELVYVLKAVSQAGLVTGVSAEAQQRVFWALQQMLSKTTVSQEELKQQMGEALPMAMGAMSRALGITVAELSKLVETGKLATDDVLVPFAMQLDKETAIAAKKAGDSISAATGKMKNAWFDLQRAFLTGKVGAGVEAQLTSTVGLIDKATEVLKGLEPYAAKMHTFFQVTVTYMAKALEMMAPVVGAIKDSFGAWSKSISAAMIWLKPLADLLATVIVGALKTIDTIARTIFDGITATIKALEKIKPRLQRGLFRSDIIVPVDFPVEAPEEFTPFIGQGDDWAAITEEIGRTSEAVNELGRVTATIGDLAAGAEEKYAETIKKIQAMAKKSTKAIGDDWAAINNEIASTLLERGQELMDFLSGMAESSAGIVKDFLYDVVTDFDSAFSNLFKRLIDRIYDVVIEMLVIQPLIDNIFAPMQAKAGAGVPLGGGGGGGGDLIGTLVGGITKLFGFAEGGIIKEPVVGVGLKSGAGYAIAERGPEVVAPITSGSAASGQGQVNQYSITIQALDAQSAAEFMRRNPEAVLGPITTAIQHGNKGLMGALRTAM